MDLARIEEFTWREGGVVIGLYASTCAVDEGGV